MEANPAQNWIIPRPTNREYPQRKPRKVIMCGIYSHKGKEFLDLHFAGLATADLFLVLQPLEVTDDRLTIGFVQ